ncbi:MAG: hypothetical protein H7Y15_11300 [Pseudonocardia sp.]|nr:hypothetical protein [Pseudonocardia sp.]
MAARVAHTFNQDPVAMLDNGGDMFLTHVRIAAAKVVSDDERKQAEAQKKKTSGRRARRR